MTQLKYTRRERNFLEFEIIFLMIAGGALLSDGSSNITNKGLIGGIMILIGSLYWVLKDELYPVGNKK